MKKPGLKSVLALASIFVLFSSCELFEGADDVTFDVELTYTFDITDTGDSNGQPRSYFSTGSLDPNSDPDFQKYKDKIKSVTVNSVDYTVAEFDDSDGDVIFSNGLGFFAADATSQTTATATAYATANIAIQSVAAAEGADLTLDYSIDELEAIADRLEDVQPVFFAVSGTFSKTPAVFKIPVVIHCTIKADAL
jgi:hypothetical protein